jgi:glucose-1-phosphate thymidylyltransferase
MKIIVPMAGRGSRLRPHTLTVPKPLIPIAGKPIVQRLVWDIAQVLKQPIEEVAFIISRDFGPIVEENLRQIAHNMGAKASIYYQDKPLGTGHAVMCAQDSLHGPCVIAYADTLFRANFELDPQADSMIWVKEVANPQQYGVVQLNNQNQIVGLVEKPQSIISNLAVIGIYYFKKAEELKEQLQEVLDNQLTRGGEYQINDGILAMIQKGKVFVPGQIDEWMDCGNKQVTVETNSRMLQLLATEGEVLIHPNIIQENATIIPPCYIGEHVEIRNTTIGPHVSIGNHCVIENSHIKNSLIQTHTQIKNAQLNHAMIGNHVIFDGTFSSVSLGDYSTLE